MAMLTRRGFLRGVAALPSVAIPASLIPEKPVEYIELTAARHSGQVRVFLNGEDVSNCTVWARVPREPGVVAEGAIERHVTVPPMRTPITEHVTGLVYWLPVEDA